MKEWNMLMASVLLLTAAFFVMPLAVASEKSVGSANDSQNEAYNTTELKSFVESAVAYAHENGKDKALDEYSNKTGSFVQGNLYIYAYDFNGTNIAHPFKPDWIGKDKINQTDSNGVLYIRNLIEVARGGKGFTYFIFPNPAHDNKDEFKIGYAMKVDETWWLGSGIYVSCP
jgi:cytochrome c